MDKATLRVEAADDLVSLVVSPSTTYPLEPWRTYVPTLPMLWSTVAPVILQSGAVHVSATQSASTQSAYGFGQNMRFIVERKANFCSRDSALDDEDKMRESLGADLTSSVGFPVKSATNLKRVLVSAIADPDPASLLAVMPK